MTKQSSLNFEFVSVPTKQSTVCYNLAHLTYAATMAFLLLLMVLNRDRPNSPKNRRKRILKKLCF